MCVLYALNFWFRSNGSRNWRSRFKRYFHVGCDDVNDVGFVHKLETAIFNFSFDEIRLGWFQIQIIFPCLNQYFNEIKKIESDIGNRNREL